MLDSLVFVIMGSISGRVKLKARQRGTCHSLTCLLCVCGGGGVGNWQDWESTSRFSVRARGLSWTWDDAGSDSMQA